LNQTEIADKDRELDREQILPSQMMNYAIVKPRRCGHLNGSGKTHARGPATRTSNTYALELKLNFT